MLTQNVLEPATSPVSMCQRSLCRTRCRCARSSRRQTLHNTGNPLKRRETYLIENATVKHKIMNSEPRVRWIVGTPVLNGVAISMLLAVVMNVQGAKKGNRQNSLGSIGLNFHDQSGKKERTTTFLAIVNYTCVRKPAEGESATETIHLARNNKQLKVNQQFTPSNLQETAHLQTSWALFVCCDDDVLAQRGNLCPHPRHLDSTLFRFHVNRAAWLLAAIVT